MTKLMILSVNPADQADLCEAVQAVPRADLPQGIGSGRASAGHRNRGALVGSFFGRGHLWLELGGHGRRADDGKTQSSRRLTHRQREILPAKSLSARRRS